MTIAAIVQEFEQEAKTTRRVLERVPSDKLDWQPHAKSMSLGTLAMHIAMAPGYISSWPLKDSFEFTGDPTPTPSSPWVLSPREPWDTSGGATTSRQEPR